MKNSRDNTQFCAAILTDLSKAFDLISYDLLIAKLNANGFDQVTLELIHSYLCDRSQSVKVGYSFSKELDILCGVPQGSILGPLLFNSFMWFVFYWYEFWYCKLCGWYHSLRMCPILREIERKFGIDNLQNIKLFQVWQFQSQCY